MDLYLLLLAPTYAISLFAVALSLRTFRNARLNKRLRGLETDLAALENHQEKLLTAYRSLNSRVGMREKRAKEAKNPRGQETPEEWKRRKRAELFAKRGR